MPYKSGVVCSRIANCQEDGKKILKTFLWLICVSVVILKYLLYIYEEVYDELRYVKYIHDEYTRTGKLPNSHGNYQIHGNCQINSHK